MKQVFRKNREVRVNSEKSCKALSEACTTSQTRSKYDSSPIKIAERLKSNGLKKKKLIKLNLNSCHSTGLPYTKNDKKVKGLEDI